MQYVAFGVWISSFSITVLRLIDATTHVSGVIPCVAEQRSAVRVFQDLFSHAPANGYLACFQFLVIINRALCMGVGFYFSWITNEEKKVIRGLCAYIQFL